MIIHLNGWPGVGKQTIGRKLSEKLGARFIHNHMLHDVAIACAGFNDPDRWPLYETVRRAAYDVLAKRPASEVLVMTNALCKGARREQVAWKHVVDLAIARNVPLIPVVLEADPKELVRRVQIPDRVGKKMTDQAQLREFLASDELQYPAVPETLALDVTALLPDEAVARLQGLIAGLGGSLKPATARHLDMR